MDGGASDLELLLAAARLEVEGIRGDPRLGKLPGKRGTALRCHLLDLVGAVEHRMAQEPPSTAAEPVRRAFARSLRQGIHMLRGAYAALPWLAATRVPNLNLGSLYMTEECARILVGTDVDLVVVPNPEYMYATTSWPFSAVIDHTPGFTPRTARRPIVLNYPLSDSDRLLLHPIFAHELGHASADEHGLVGAVEADLDGDTSFTAALQQTVEDIAASWTAIPTTQISGMLRGWLRDWIEELLCDHLAIEASGPAFIWAFAMFVMPFSYGEPGSQHPPNTVRMRLALDHLARRGWRPYMERVAPGVTAWLDEIAGHASGHLDIQFAFLRDQLLAHASALQDAAIGRAAAKGLDPGASEAAADEAAMLLSRLILPVGLSDPLEERAILLGGWQHAFRDHGDSPSGMVRALADRRLQDLIGKAIEMSTVTAAWEPET
ncbi:MAG: hypothetical protein LC808_26910 [Actinobacteria bacterium]|nr:hypothetical protein [Actinomycetota bacterium]